MTRERLLRYLDVLDLEDPEDLSDRLRQLLTEEPGLRWLPDDPSGDVSLGRHGSIRTKASCDSFTRRFLRWWGDRLSDREDRRVDALTGLCTRSGWERSLKPPMEDGRWAVALGDIDRFKRFNDHHGHDMGDRVLEAVGEAARDHFRPEDRLVRYGGEELLFVLPAGTDPHGRVDAFRRHLEAGKLFPEQPETITLSLGLALKDRDESFDAVVGRADRALYVSKDRGRNRLTRYAPYMDHLRSLSIWGFYRYLWDRNVRFGLGTEGRNFLVAAGELIHYRWAANESETHPVPEEVETPIRGVVGAGEGFLLLDADGELWRWDAARGHRRFGQPSTPSMVCLVGGREGRWAVGLNNQLYQLVPTGPRHAGSLPARWDYVAGDRRVLVVHEGTAFPVTDTENPSVELPVTPRQVTMDGETLVVVGFEGGLYALDPAVSRWQQYRLPRLDRRPVYCREVSVRGSRVLLRDGQGRLLLTDRRDKAVPQAMDLDPGVRTVP